MTWRPNSATPWTFRSGRRRASRGPISKVRTEETNLGNLVADILRDASGADACVLNGGTLRSDVIHPPGALTFRDLVAILPMLDETCVLG